LDKELKIGSHDLVALHNRAIDLGAPVGSINQEALETITLFDQSMRYPDIDWPVQSLSEEEFGGLFDPLVFELRRGFTLSTDRFPLGTLLSGKVRIAEWDFASRCVNEVFPLCQLPSPGRECHHSEGLGN
jgi:hypothetical protein